MKARAIMPFCQSGRVDGRKDEVAISCNFMVLSKYYIEYENNSKIDKKVKNAYFL
ncbi:hypothetical protein [Desulfovibrio litoralis]|uniref:Uncharacterized protein n=1 Tax=Desulfovibrio litoralis DSM 11393 TaxID=1121455 RepID=A0A1M7T154_9BACT|nr:hypothetical protein [Desulfovibrio litoralis]SHN64490.1 hypothetical protein SAMN02745728_01430 [Desulfovibrio litoralis DSM 11393]